MKHKSVGQVGQMLVDIVGKNGKLLRNIPLHPDGSIDGDEEAILKGMGAWMRLNGEETVGFGSLVGTGPPTR